MLATRRRLFWIIGVAVALAIIALLVVFAARGAGPENEDGTLDGTSERAPDPVSVQTPAAPVTDEAIVPGLDASRIVSAPLAGLAQALADPAVPVDLSAVASGVALADLNAEVLSFAREGLQQVGTPEIVAAEVVSVDAEATPPTTLVNVCIDGSTVKILDADGKEMTNPAAPARVKQVWTMASTESGWVLVDRTFTDDLAC